MTRTRTKGPPTCNQCGQRIIWATTTAGKKQALDPAPNPLGSVWAYHEVSGWRSRAAAGPKVHPLERIYMVHFATCPQRAQQEKIPEGPRDAPPPRAHRTRNVFATREAAVTWMRKQAGPGHTTTEPHRLYRYLAKAMHPDAGGDPDDWALLDQARQALELADR